MSHPGLEETNWKVYLIDISSRAEMVVVQGISKYTQNVFMQSKVHFVNTQNDSTLSALVTK